MRIDQLEFRNTNTGWHLQPTRFFPDLTLLVGTSGVGKTRILRAILALQRLTFGTSFPGGLSGIAWNIQCSAEGAQYVWTGELEKLPDNDGEIGTGRRPGWLPHGRFLEERVIRDGVEILSRQGETIRFQRNTTPRLSPTTSALALFQEESVIAPLYRGFRQITHLTVEAGLESGALMMDRHSLARNHPDLPSLLKRERSIFENLVALPFIDPALFKTIVSRFREIFPVIEDVRVKGGPASSPTNEYFELQIKERGIDTWIMQEYISSGMMRTLLHLAAISLSPDDSLILIDEFENSLGVNCINEVAQDLMSNRRRLQFIVTSHHPYIINHIPPQNWKIVTRENGTVKTLTAAEVGIGRSRHEAFTQLINSPAYTGVVE